MASIWCNQQRQEAIEKFFNYADKYLTKLNHAVEAGDDDVFEFVDHFLVFLTAAAQNLCDATFVFKPNEGPGEPKKKCILSTPFATELEHESELLPVIWAWEARNTLAHRCVQLGSQEALLSANGSHVSVSSRTLRVNGFFLKQVRDRKGNSINPPKGSAVIALKVALDFWRFTYEYVLARPHYQDKFEYKALWAEFKRDPTL